MNNNLVNEDIIETVVHLMEQAQRMINKTGIEKKYIVMKEVKKILGEESYERYQFFIEIFIDFTIKVSHGKFKINLKKIKNKFCCYS